MQLEKEEYVAAAGGTSKGESSSHCCTTFSDINPALQRSAIAGSTCCVSFRTHLDGHNRARERKVFVAVIALAFFFFLALTLVLTNNTEGRCRICEVGEMPK